MTYNVQAALNRRGEGFYSRPEIEAYRMGYDLGFYGIPGLQPDPANNPMVRDYPNAYTAGYWDGYGDNEAKVAQPAPASRGMSAETFALLLFTLFMLGMCARF